MRQGFAWWWHEDGNKSAFGWHEYRFHVKEYAVVREVKHHRQWEPGRRWLGQRPVFSELKDYRISSALSPLAQRFSAFSGHDGQELPENLPLFAASLAPEPTNYRFRWFLILEAVAFYRLTTAEFLCVATTGPRTWISWLKLRRPFHPICPQSSYFPSVSSLIDPSSGRCDAGQFGFAIDSQYLCFGFSASQTQVAFSWSESESVR